MYFPPSLDKSEFGSMQIVEPQQTQRQLAATDSKTISLWNVRWSQLVRLQRVGSGDRCLQAFAATEQMLSSGTAEEAHHLSSEDVEGP